MKAKLVTIAIGLGLFFFSFVFAQTPASPEPTQNKISLDFKGMDIVDVLKILAARSEMNLVVGKNVAGRVTLFLKDVDLRDAFEIILLSNDLAYEKKGDIINEKIKMNIG